MSDFIDPPAVDKHGQLGNAKLTPHSELIDCCCWTYLIQEGYQLLPSFHNQAIASPVYLESKHAEDETGGGGNFSCQVLLIAKIDHIKTDFTLDQLLCSKIPPSRYPCGDNPEFRLNQEREDMDQDFEISMGDSRARVSGDFIAVDVWEPSVMEMAGRSVWERGRRGVGGLRKEKRRSE